MLQGHAWAILPTLTATAFTRSVSNQYPQQTVSQPGYTALQQRSSGKHCLKAPRCFPHHFLSVYCLWHICGKIGKCLILSHSSCHPTDNYKPLLMHLGYGLWLSFAKWFKWDGWSNYCPPLSVPTPLFQTKLHRMCICCFILLNI